MPLPQDAETQLADQFCFEKVFLEFARRQERMLEQMMSLLLALNAKADAPVSLEHCKRGSAEEAVTCEQWSMMFANHAEYNSANVRASSQSELPRELEHTESEHAHCVTNFRSSADSATTLSTLGARRRISVELEVRIKALDNTKRRRHVDRLRRLMELGNDAESIEPKHIVLALTKKAPSHSTAMLHEDTIRFFMRSLAELIGYEHTIQNEIMLVDLVDLLLLPDLPSRLDGQFYYQARVIQQYLMHEDGTDFIMTRVSSHRLTRETSPHIDTPILDHLVLCAVILSLFVLGTSSDVAPEAFFWIVIEGVVGCVLLTETIFKIRIYGWRPYFTGTEWRMHILDVCLTAIAVLDITISLIVYGTQGSGDMTTGRLAMFARLLKLARIARLLKAARASVVKHILTGCFVALPTLWSILFLLLAYVYVVGVMFRMFVGPEAGQDLMSVCPNADDMTATDDKECKVHWLYGEQYFGSTLTSMFTVFRCTIGDCASRGGRSLTANLSHGFGVRFDAIYCLGMVLIMFGLFNVINAIFVESVIKGLKHKELRSRHKEFYDPAFVNESLTQLSQRIHELIVNCEFIQEADYVSIVKDESVSHICAVLDVSLYDLENKFDMFDTHGGGHITESQFLKTILMLRGETQKSDVVSSLVVVRGLREQLEEHQRVVLAHQRHMVQNQRQLFAQVASLSGRGASAMGGSIVVANIQDEDRRRKYWI